MSAREGENVIRIAEALGERGTRDRILDTAIEMGARYGLMGLSLQMLADQVGIHKSTLFHHFENKSELGDEALARVLEPVLEQMAPLADAAAPQLEQLVDVVERLVDHFADQRGRALFMLRCLIGPDGFDGRGEPRTDGSDPVSRVLTLLGTWLYRAREAGAIREVRIRHAIVNLLGLALLYPALSDGEGMVLFGGDPSAPAARNARKAELTAAIRGMLTPD